MVIRLIFAWRSAVAIKRPRIARKGGASPEIGSRVTDLPAPWAFEIKCPHHGKIAFDFTEFRRLGRESLAGQVRDAFYSLRHDITGATLKSYYKLMRRFWLFLDSRKASGESLIDLKQINRSVVDQYLVWLELQMAETDAGTLSLGSRKQSYVALKAILRNRQIRTPSAVSAELTFPKNPFPNSNRSIPKRQPYSQSEQKRIVQALNKDLKNLHEEGGEALSSIQILLLHALILALVTGRNATSLLELRRNCLQPHPLQDRELLTTYKRRGWSTHATSYRKIAEEDEALITPIPATAGEHIRFLMELTAPLMKDAQPEDRDFVFLWQVSRKNRKGQVVRVAPENLTRTGCGTFVDRHVLKDDRGRRLILNLARLRPTFATELYRRTRDIRRVQQALGQSWAETTARHYVEPLLEAERDHALVVEGMVGRLTRYEIEGKVLLAADGLVPLKDVPMLLEGGYNTGIARCKNPFRENESVCKKFLFCFRCPSMMVFEDDLWRLFSFYYRILFERPKIAPDQWLKTYGPILKRVDSDIATQFPTEIVDAARTRAKSDPHPTWKGYLL